MRKRLYGDERECFVCHTTLDVEMHHVWGSSRRPIADREGCVVPLCHFHHQHPRYGAHGWDKTLERRLRADCQRRWEEREVHESGISAEEARERFRATFYESYL